MNYLKLGAIATVLMFYGATATPVQASTISELQSQLVSLINRLISLLTQQQTTGGTAPIATTTIATTTQPTPPLPVSPTVLITAAYTIDDVVSVTYRPVDPIPRAIDDEYALHTIVLKDGTTRLVKVTGFSPYSMKQEAFYSSGYVGDVEKILSLAVIAPLYTDTSVIHVVAQTGREVVIDVSLSRNTSAGISSVMGPVVLGSISWGDGSVVENISGLQTSSATAKTMTLTHTFAAAGTYTIAVTDTFGQKTTQTIIVK